MSEDEYQAETRARVVLFSVIVALAVLIGATIYVNSLPSSPVPESPRPVEPHMSPFTSGSGAESVADLAPFLIGATIFMLSSLVVIFYVKSRKEKVSP